MQTARSASVLQDTKYVDMAQSVFANDIISNVDTALNLFQGFLTQLPDTYRENIRSPYLHFLNAIEEENNKRYAEIFSRAKSAFYSTNQDLLKSDPLLYERKLDFHLLQLEDQLIAQELSTGFGKKNWGVIPLRRTNPTTPEPVFELYRWLIVLFNRSTLDEAQKSLQTKEILAQRGDASLIDLMLPKETQTANEINDKKKGTPVGIFTKNAFHHLEAKVKRIYDAKKFKLGKLKNAKEQLAKLPKGERLLLLIWNYYQTYYGVTVLRVQDIRKLCQASKAFKPYVPNFQFPAPVIPGLEMQSSRVSINLNNKRASMQPVFILPGSPQSHTCKEFFAQMNSCRKCFNDLISVMNVHLEIDFEEKDRQSAQKKGVKLTDSIGTLSINETQLPESVQTIRKLMDYKRAFELINGIFDRVHRLLNDKDSSSPFTL